MAKSLADEARALGLLNGNNHCDKQLKNYCFLPKYKGIKFVIENS